MKSNRQEYFLRNLISIKHGYAFKGDAITSEDNSVVLVTPGNFAIGGGFQENKCKFFTGEYPKEYLLKPGDLIVTMTDLSKAGDTLGYGAIVPKSTRIYLHNQRIGLVSILNQNIEKEYLYWFMRTRDYQKSVLASSSGSVIKHTSPNRIGEIKICLPPIAEQREISSTLSSLDTRIAENTKINHHLEQMAQAIFKSWFVDFEPFGGTMPGDWRNGTLSGIAPNIYSGGTPNTSKKSYWNGEIPWLSSGETRNHFIISTEKQITQNGVNNSSTKLAHRFDVVMASAGQGLTRGQTSLLLFDSYINQSVIVMHGNSPFYLFLNLLARYEELRAISDSSSIRGSITTKMLAQFPMLLPSQDALTDFSNTIKPLFGQIENNLRENACLAELREALLPRLMSGELSVAELGDGK